MLQIGQLNIILQIGQLLVSHQTEDFGDRSSPLQLGLAYPHADSFPAHHQTVEQLGDQQHLVASI